MSLQQRSQPATTTSMSTMPMASMATAPAHAVQGNDLRRENPRALTVCRIVRVETERDRGLGRVRNMSDGGMKLSLSMPVLLGDRVRVALTDATELTGRVVWTDGNECGLQFTQTVDSASVLRETAQHCRSPEARSPRLRADLPAVATSTQGRKAVKVHDVSLRGMKLGHDGSLTPGLPVKVRFNSGVERRGVIRWADDKLAGLMLLEQFAVEDLGVISAL